MTLKELKDYLYKLPQECENVEVEFYLERNLGFGSFMELKKIAHFESLPNAILTFVEQEESGE